LFDAGGPVPRPSSKIPPAASSGPPDPITFVRRDGRLVPLITGDLAFSFNAEWRLVLHLAIACPHCGVELRVPWIPSWSEPRWFLGYCSDVAAEWHLRVPRPDDGRQTIGADNFRRSVEEFLRRL
jgi:hypothetical protein